MVCQEQVRFSGEMIGDGSPIEVFQCDFCGCIQPDWPENIANRKVSFQAEAHEVQFDGSDWLEAAEITGALAALEPFLPPLANNPRALDIGAGRGNFTAALAQAGYDVLGLEPSTRLCLKGRELYNLAEEQLVPESFEDFYQGNNEQRFELIVAWHVLEHVPKPKNFLTNISDLLAEDGVLFLQVPGLSENQFHELHLCFFSSKLLHHLARAVGLTISYMEWDFERLFLTCVMVKTVIFHQTGRESKKELSVNPIFEQLMASATLNAQMMGRIRELESLANDASRYRADLQSNIDRLRTAAFLQRLGIRATLKSLVTQIVAKLVRSPLA